MGLADWVADGGESHTRMACIDTKGQNLVGRFDPYGLHLQQSDGVSPLNSDGRLQELLCTLDVHVS